MGNALGNPRKRAGTKRHPEATSEKKRKRRSDKLGMENHNIDTLLKKHKAGAQAPAKRKKEIITSKPTANGISRPQKI